MPHTYATVAQGNDEIKSGGSTTFASDDPTIVAKKLGVLEAVSRRIEDVSHRSKFHSGFGPRIGTNKYDGDGIGGYFMGGAYGANTLALDDDLQSVTSMKLYDLTAASTYHSPVLDTDYFLANAEGYTGPPWRKVILHGRGTPVVFGVGFRVTEITGVWGQSNVTVTSSATLAEDLDTSETGVDVSAGTAFSPGMTLLIDAEQLYVSAISTNTLTVVRGANGSTAAVHTTGAAIAVYQYDARVVLVARRLFMKRWGPDIGQPTSDQPGVVGIEGEDTIIRRGLGDLLLLGQY